MAGARPEPHRDADRILTRVDAVTNAMEKISRVQSRAAQKQTEIARRTEVETQGDSVGKSVAKYVPTALKASSLATDAYKLAKWTDPLGGALGLGTHAVEKATGHDSVASNVTRQASFLVDGAEALAGHPVAIAKTAVALPQQLKDMATLPFAGAKSAYNSVKERGGEAVAGAKDVGGALGGMGLTNNYGSERGSEQLAAIGAASAHFLKAGAGKTMGGAASYVVGPPVLFAKLAGRLQDFSDHLHSANMRFAEFSGAMAGVQAAQEIREIRMSQERGDQLAPSAGYLAENKSALDNSLGKIETSFGVFKNLGGGLLDDIANFFVEPWGDVAENLTNGINEISKWLGMEAKSKDDGTEIEDWLEATTKKRWLEDYGRPQRFRE